MFKFLKQLWRDRRGNAILIAGAAMPVVIGGAGLASDTVQWVLWKRQLQRAADSAAFAGVYAKSVGDDASVAVSTDLLNNNQAKNQSGVDLMSGYPQLSYPTSVNWSYGVKVDLAIQQRLSFSSLFVATAPTITASATAALVDFGEYCLVGLKKSGAAITIGGSSTASLGCGGISNANVNPSVSTNGSSYSFTAPVMAGVGNMPTSISGVTTVQPYHTAMPDPFEGKYSTNIPSGMSCNTFSQHRTNLGNGQNPNWHLSPGCYTGFNPNGSAYTLDPGVYYLNNTNFQLNGNDALVGTGVTIVLTGTTPGSVQTNGNSTVQLSAPTTSNCGADVNGVNTCNYKNMLFIQSPNAVADNNNTINGSATSSWDGALYFPKGQVSFTGSSGSITKCAMVVGYTIAFSGNTNLQNDTTGCHANETVPAKIVKLVA